MLAWERLLVRAREVTSAIEQLQQSIAQEFGLTRARWSLLASVVAVRSSVAKHARSLGLTRQSVQRTADNLVERGMARFEANPDHRRSPLLLPTSSGVETISALERALEERLSSVAVLIETEDIESAMLTLQALRDEIESQI